MKSRLHSRLQGRLHRALETWLEREQRSAEVVREATREAAAERALREVFRRLPLDRPSAGFADRVLARAGVVLAPPSGLPVWFPAPVLRGLTAVCLLLTGSAAVFLPRAVIVLAPNLDWNGWITRVADAATGAAQQIVGTLATWEALVGVGSTFADIIFSPALVGVMTASLFLSAAAMRALHDLIVPSRSV